jgi:hypothetical protein
VGEFQGIWFCFSGELALYNDQRGYLGRIPGKLVLFRSATVVLKEAVTKKPLPVRHPLLSSYIFFYV